MRPFFIGLSISLGYSINPLVMAQYANSQLQERIHNFNFSKEDIEFLIGVLLNNEKISERAAEDALMRLREVSVDEIKHITMDAFQNFKEFQEFEEFKQEEEDHLLFGVDFDTALNEDLCDKNTKKTKKETSIKYTKKTKKYQ